MSDTSTDTTQLRLVVATILDDEEFRRSPVLSHLLTYLLEMTTKSIVLKSQTIAIDGLGRPYDDRGEADTYARVTVTRLRKALSNYCATHPDAWCVQIDPGTYGLKLRSKQDMPKLAPVESRVSSKQKNQSTYRSLGWMLAGGAVAILTMIAGIFQITKRNARSAWSGSNFPTLMVRPIDGNAVDVGVRARLVKERQALAAALQDYVGLRVVEDVTIKPDYEVRLYKSDEGLDGGDHISLVEIASGRLIWSGRLSAPRGKDEASGAGIAAAVIASPGGVLTSFARRRGYDVNTPYGCWLRFTEDVQTYNTVGDSRLSNCAQQWYAAMPDSATAAFLYSWTRSDASVLELVPLKKSADLQLALNVVHRSLALNPDVAMLNIAEMRAYSFVGDRERVRRAARDALVKARSNRLAAGMAASGLALWNDPDGDRLLRALVDTGGSAYPWEHVGQFVAAMMRDDITAAGAQQMNLDQYNTGQPLLLLLRAAYAARIGRRDIADVAMAQLRRKQIVPGVGVDQIVGRLPAAPEVRARLSEWLRTPITQQPKPKPKPKL